MTHWAQTADLGYQTLTRFEDPANNVNKFRRFIAIGHPINTNEKILITQTGRWTGARARGIWGTSTYRFIKEATFDWERRCSLFEFLEKNVEKKKGQYLVSPSLDRAPMTHAEVRQAVQFAKGMPGAAATTSTPLPTPPPVQQTVKRVARPVAGNLLQLAPWLVQAAGDKGWAQFDLLPEYADIKAKADTAKAQLEQVYADLDTALSLIMLKES